MKPDERIKQFVGLLISKLIIPEKIIPSILLNHPDVKREQLERAATFVEKRIKQSINSLKVFQADLFLTRIPNLEFLEVMILLYYFIGAIERMPTAKIKQVPVNELLEAKKILRAFGIERSNDLSSYWDIWKEIYPESEPESENEARKAFESMKEMLDKD